MPATILAGSRIREHRLARRMQQSALARRVGVSASYLNLIEHNRRKIGGKLLVNIAEELDIDVRLLAEGAQAALTDMLNSVAAGASTAIATAERAEDFAGRFPGWAQLLVTAHRRVGELEHLVETLSDRLTHDPKLAASLHEVLSTVTAIRSTAAILHDTPDLEASWRARFSRNLNEDSRRLAEGAQTLVGFLDSGAAAADRLVSPQEEFDAFLDSHDHHFAELEGPAPIDPAQMIAQHTQIKSGVAKRLALRHLERYRADARAMPIAQMTECLAQADGPDPAVIAARFGVGPAAAMRRLSQLPAEAGLGPVGLVVSDASGALLLRRSLDGFDIPRFSAACPLWPLFQAFSRPMSPLRAHLVQVGRTTDVYDCFAIASPVATLEFDSPPQFEATMLILPERDASRTRPVSPREVGPGCRLCARALCPARREPSVLVDDLADDFDR